MLFRVPHYHVLQRTGYAVWTYEHGQLAPRQVRHLTAQMIEAGLRPIILTCLRQDCRLYGIAIHAIEEVHARIDRERHVHDSYRLTPAP